MIPIPDPQAPGLINSCALIKSAPCLFLIGHIDVFIIKIVCIYTYFYILHSKCTLYIQCFMYVRMVFDLNKHRVAFVM